MNLMYLKVIGGVGAGAAGITGAYFAIEGSKNPTTSTPRLLGEEVESPDNINKELTRREKENQKNNEKVGTNAQRFIKDYKLLEKPAKDILKLIEEKLEYKIESVSEDSLKKNLDSYLLSAMESFCISEGENNAGEIFKKYCDN